MRIIIVLILLFPLAGFSQNQVFIKLTDNKAQPIKGEVLVKGYERAIQAITTNSGGKNNTQFDFTMPVTGAAADLKKAMSTGQLLSGGEVYVITPNMGAGTMVYSIKMEQITVLSCTEAMGCNNVLSTTVSLRATRIGWTYYTQNKTGALSVSRKYGWDAATGLEWTAF